MADKEKKFSGIFGGLKKLIFTEDFLDKDTPPDNTEDAPIKMNTTATGAAKATGPAPINTSGVIASNMASEDMIAKIYGLFESINKPGVDFFELWNAAEAMGGVNAVNLQNAFTSFKVLGLTKEVAISTGEAYINELQTRLNEDIRRKIDDKENLNTQLNTEKNNLQTHKQQLEEQIKQLNSQLMETSGKLSQVEGNYMPAINEIDKKINSGRNALNVVVTEITNVLTIVKNNLK